MKEAEEPPADKGTCPHGDFPETCALCAEKPSSGLRGDLLRKTEPGTADSSPEDSSSRLRGRLLEQAAERPPSRLRGRLLKKDASPAIEEKPSAELRATQETLRAELQAVESNPIALETFLEGHRYIQRDSKSVFVIEGFSTQRNGGRLVRLYDPDRGTRVNLSLSDFVHKLKTDRSPWSFKEKK